MEPAANWLHAELCLPGSWPSTVSDFTLALDFRIDAGNSGVNYRSLPGGEHGKTGYQAVVVLGGWGSGW